MHHRAFASTAVLAVAIVTAVPAAAGQAQTAPKGPEPAKSGGTAKAPAKAPAKAWKATRTPWGDPDLQGVWNDATSTPLQRPNELAGKDVLSDEEAQDFQQQNAFNLTRDRRDGGSAADVNRAYNEHWMDSRRLKITERFTRVDADTLNYEFTIDDPGTWTRPWSARMPWTKIDPNEQMYEYACHEDNFDIVHFFLGARAREKRGEVFVPRPAGGAGGGAGAGDR